MYFSTWITTDICHIVYLTPAENNLNECDFYMT